MRTSGFRQVCMLVLVCTTIVPGVYASPLKEIDLASDEAWTLSIDGGPTRPIRVPGGGWNSDQQEPQIPSAGVKDHVIYERRILIPQEAQNNVVKVLFGGCNYGAEVYLDGQKVTEHHAPMTPLEADLTDLARPGRTYVLRVKAYTRFHYGKHGKPTSVTAGFDFNKGMSRFKRYDGHTKYAYGLTGYVSLAIYPSVHISDVFVRTSVRSRTLEYDVWVSNGSKQRRTVTVSGVLASWRGKVSGYPDLPKHTVAVNAGETRTVTVKNVTWNLGADSYWWPNIPFRDDYKATLHWLRLSLEEGGKPVHQRQQRFGFAEYREGPYYYTVNGVRFTSFGDSNSYGQVGEYGCWSETPCFLPPDGTFKGCPETWKRYQRIGFNSMRLSTSVPTRRAFQTTFTGPKVGRRTRRVAGERCGASRRDTALRDRCQVVPRVAPCASTTGRAWCPTARNFGRVIHRSLVARSRLDDPLDLLDGMPLGSVSPPRPSAWAARAGSSRRVSGSCRGGRRSP